MQSTAESPSIKFGLSRSMPAPVASATDLQPRAVRCPPLLPCFKKIQCLSWGQLIHSTSHTTSRVHCQSEDELQELLARSWLLCRETKRDARRAWPLGISDNTWEIPTLAAQVPSPSSFNKAMPMSVANSMTREMRRGLSNIKTHVCQGCKT